MVSRFCGLLEAALWAFCGYGDLLGLVLLGVGVWVLDFGVWSVWLYLTGLVEEFGVTCRYLLDLVVSWVFATGVWVGIIYGLALWVCVIRWVVGCFGCVLLVC